MHKYKNLDGLRGLAALVVVFWHYAVGFLPFLVGFNATVRHTPIDKLVSTTPLFLPLAGTFSVVVFFVLSGFVLSLSFFNKKTHDVLISSAARRYFRLMIPAAGSVFLGFLLMTIIGIHAHQEAAQITGSTWLAEYWPATANLGSAIYQAFYSVFFTGFTAYNTNLWTMQLELFGSFMVFSFLGFFGNLPRRWFFYAVIMLATLKTYYLAFILGMALCDVWTNCPGLKRYLTNRVAIIGLPFVIFLGAWHASLNINMGIYNRIVIPYFNYVELETFVRTIAALLLVIAVLQLSWMRRFFELRPLQYLGRISFSLYLVHFVILYSVSSLLFAKLYPHFGYGASFGGMLIIMLPLTFVVATLYAKYVDGPSIGWSKSIGSWLLAAGRADKKLVQSEGTVTSDSLPAIDAP